MWTVPDFPVHHPPITDKLQSETLTSSYITPHTKRVLGCVCMKLSHVEGSRAACNTERHCAPSTSSSIPRGIAFFMPNHLHHSDNYVKPFKNVSGTYHVAQHVVCLVIWRHVLRVIIIVNYTGCGKKQCFLRIQLCSYIEEKYEQLRHKSSKIPTLNLRNTKQ